MPSVISSIASPSAVSIRSGSPLRRAPESSTRRPASCCSVSSCSSRAQRPRSASEASMLRRSASSVAFCAVATAVAALAANACSSRSSSSLNGRSSRQAVEHDQEAERAVAEQPSASRSPCARRSRAPANVSGGISSKRCERPVRQRLGGERVRDRHPRALARPRRPRRRPRRSRTRRRRAARSRPRARSSSARERLTTSSSTRSRSVTPPSARLISVVVSRPRIVRSSSSRRSRTVAVEARVGDRDRRPSRRARPPPPRRPSVNSPPAFSVR